MSERGPRTFVPLSCALAALVLLCENQFTCQQAGQRASDERDAGFRQFSLDLQCGIATGDQAMFVTRRAFDAVRGFPDQALMEDVELSSRLKRRGRPLCLRPPVVTSGRRWDARGVARTILLMWWIRLLYVFGVAPNRLARLYR